MKSLPDIIDNLEDIIIQLTELADDDINIDGGRKALIEAVAHLERAGD